MKHLNRHKSLLVKDEVLNQKVLKQEFATPQTIAFLQPRKLNRKELFRSQLLSETAEVFHGVVAVDPNIIYRPELRERFFGQWELQDVSRYQKVWDADEKAVLNGDEGVESVYQVLERVLKLVYELDAQSVNKTYLLIAHGDVLQILLCHFHGLDVRWHRHVAMIKNAEIRLLKPGSLVRNIA